MGETVYIDLYPNICSCACWCVGMQESICFRFLSIQIMISLRRCDSRFSDRRPFPISTRYRLMANFHTTLFRHSTLLRHAEKQCSPSACLSTAFSVFIRLLALLSNVFEIKFEALLTFEHQNMFILCLINKKRRAIEIFPIAFQSAEIKSLTLAIKDALCNFFF